MQKLHDWLGKIKAHKSHYSRGRCPMRQYTEHGLNIHKLWKDYTNDAIRYEREYVSLTVFRNVFTHVYNISTRYVL